MRQTTLITVLLLAVILLGGGSTSAHIQGLESVKQNVSTTTSSTPENTSLLTKQDLFREIIEDDRNKYNASLYYVTEDNVWYHAYPNETIGSKALFGDVVPDIDVALHNGTKVNETIHISSEIRPIYVWKVIESEYGTTVYNASDGNTIASYIFTGSVKSTNSTETDNPQQTTDITTSNQSVRKQTTSNTGPGFGIGVLCISFLSILIYFAHHWN